MNCLVYKWLLSNTIKLLVSPVIFYSNLDLFREKLKNIYPNILPFHNISILVHDSHEFCFCV